VIEKTAKTTGNYCAAGLISSLTGFQGAFGGSGIFGALAMPASSLARRVLGAGFLEAWASGTAWFETAESVAKASASPAPN
jgi:hypothetical protein